VFVLAGRAVGASAFAEGEFAALEVLLELVPLLVGGLAVFGLGALGAVLVEEASVRANELFVEDRRG
jgi:hypothetical protein